MTSQFKADPAPLREHDYNRAAARLRCPVAAVCAVAAIESAGRGFLPDRRPKILFERHVFHRETAGRYDAAHPRISDPAPGGYLGGAREYDRLEEALGLDRKAALRSASWGKFQIMGFNHALAGEPDLERFVARMVSGEPAQLDCFVAFIEARGLAGALRDCDWPAFARGYNGPGFARGGYDRRLARAYTRFATRETHQLLKSGSRGEQVSLLQRLIGVDADGVFGPRTQAALANWQRAHGLAPDGIAGARTWEALLQRVI